MDGTLFWIQPECGSGQIQENSSGPQMVCHECGFELCFTHDVPWHQDLTCEQYDANRSPSRATKKYLRRNTKQCPGCTFHIEKIDGCNHMICSECQCNFCWSCSGQEGRHTSACEDHHYDDDDVSGSDNDVELGSDNDVDNFSWIDRFGSGSDSA
ncbi:hypothetical protein SARC_09957 [Sphaeroforma arctica JP610]|uniref:RBR-type E3 ubiquitin transferase n=1 Tax=Sphaeroforma arctica JP610 TaxID=667725 RepID=A0A0L0FLD1_9EUKA|nr:hypothetical protein SARC_09957 [Sphaeroforma arctica JP610]KNC77582.1 hypothetical protein SARC_09957 [Sphaeroforma arctica JP610]|eukprot:XP_014151484.1 hypothetical protein SARC_09957 [Sphaeroforma arctica JP610]